MKHLSYIIPLLLISALVYGVATSDQFDWTPTKYEPRPPYNAKFAIDTTSYDYEVDAYTIEDGYVIFTWSNGKIYRIPEHNINLIKGL